MDSFIKLLEDYNWVAGYLLLLLVLIAVCFFIKAIYNTFKIERERTKYKEIMKVGDNIYFPVASGSKNGEITGIYGDFVTVNVIVPKNRIYPDSNG